MTLTFPHDDPAVALALAGDPEPVISSTPVVAMLEALVAPEGAAAVLEAAGIEPWATLGELGEDQAARLRAEVARRCSLAREVREAGRPA